MRGGGGFRRSAARHRRIPDHLDFLLRFPNACLADEHIGETVQFEILQQTAMVTAVGLVADHLFCPAGKKQSEQSFEGSDIVNGQSGQWNLSPEFILRCVNRFGECLRDPPQSSLSFQATQQAVPHGVRVLFEEVAADPGNDLMF